MKKVFVTILTLTLTTIAFAQKVDIGAKAGLNYNFGGDLSEFISETGNNAENIFKSNADNKAGYHVGLWARIHFLGLYVRPEIIYTQLNNSYSSEETTLETDLKTNKLDIPVLFGTKLIGPLHIYAGPSFQYIIKSDLSDEIQNINTKDFTAGLQIGTGVELGRLGIDVRWEKGFSNDLDGKFLNSRIEVDNRPNQIIFGLSYRFND